MHSRYVVAGMLLSLLLAGQAHADRPVIRLTSLEWPPYTGTDLPEGGSNTKAIREAFSKAGYDLKVSFMPWSRAIAEARNPKSSYAGYFPEYYSSKIEKDFIFSDVTGSGPLGFAEPKNKPVKWRTLWDLKPHNIGVVQDYVNTTDFDTMVSRNELKVEVAVSDTLNLKKLAENRLDLAVIDQHVFEFLLQTEPVLKEAAGQLQFNPRLLEDKGLYVCFRREGANAAMIDAFNQALNKKSP